MTNEPPLTRELRERIWHAEHFVVPFPYEWITANGGERRLVKNIGLTEEQQRGKQGDDVPLWDRKKVG